MMLYNKKERMLSGIRQARTYMDEFKTQALKLVKEIGTKRAAEELGAPKNTLGTWVHKAKKGEVDPEKGEQARRSHLQTNTSLTDLHRRVLVYPSYQKYRAAIIAARYEIISFCS